MSNKTINGVVIPVDLTIEQLEVLITSSNMNDFVAACEALSYTHDKEAFDILLKYIEHSDKYRRLYVLKTIFRHPLSSNMNYLLDKAILSEDILFVENALLLASKYNILLDVESLTDSVYQNLHMLDFNSLLTLNQLDVNEDNFVYLSKLFHKSNNCGQKEVISEMLCDKYLPDKAMELFEIFKNDDFSKIRLNAVKIGKAYNFDVSKFSEDLDGHVRNRLLF